MTANMTCVGVGSMPAYPLSVLRGCATVDELDAFKEMPDGYLRVLLRLVKKIDVCTPSKPIFARRDTLASESGKSCETVGRALRWLEDHGFINRIQVTRKFLRGSDSQILPTKKLIEALGFGHQRTKPDESGESKKAPPVKNDGSLSALHKIINIHKQSTEPVDNSSPQKKPNPSVRIGGKSVPKDLAWLVQENRLNVIAVLCLMKLARNTGKMLSDVVAVSREYLTRLQGNELFAYLRTLIQQEKDYKWIREQEEAKTKGVQMVHQQKELLARKAQEWAGRLFRSREGDKTYQIRKGGLIEVLQGGKYVASLDLSMRFLDDFESGRLQIVQA